MPPPARAASSRPARPPAELGAQLLEVQQRIAATRKQLQQDEALLREVRERVHAHDAALAQDQAQEERLVAALGGSQAAEAAVQAAAAAAPVPAPAPAPQAVPLPQVTAAPLGMPMAVPPGMFVQHLQPVPAGQQPAVVVFHPMTAPLALPNGTQQLPPMHHPQPMIIQQPVVHVPHPAFPAGVPQPAPQQHQHGLQHPPAAQPGASSDPASAGQPAQAVQRPPVQGPPPGFSGPAASAGGSPGLTPAAPEFVPRGVQRQAGAGLAQQAQHAQQRQPQQQQPQQQQPGGPTAPSQPADRRPPPGFAAAPAHEPAKPKAVHPSPLAAFPMPGSGRQLPSQQQQQQQSSPSVCSGLPNHSALHDEQQQQQCAQEAAPAPLYAQPPQPEPDTAGDAALAAALAAMESEEDVAAALAVAQAGSGSGKGHISARAPNGPGVGGSMRPWCRGSGGGGGGSSGGGELHGAGPGSALAGPSPEPVAAPAAEDFPALAAPGPAAGARGWGNPAATRHLRAALGAVTAGRAPLHTAIPHPAAAALPAWGGAPPAGPAAVEEAEALSGLRPPGDATPDAERRRMVKRQTFQHREQHARTRQMVDVTEGLELHRGVLAPGEQALVVDAVEHWVALGKSGHLRGRTFSAPKKWLPGKGRVTMQFGCCYNYAKDSQGRDPGIIPEEVVEPMPPLLRALCRRLVRWGVLPAAKEPNSAIINIYEPGDCIPPHVDHHDFTRPFCTISLLSEQDIMFGQRLVPAGPGEFVAQGGEAVHIPLPTGSCLVLKGHGGDHAMHCVPPVAQRRISITLRKMGPKHEAAVFREVKKLEAAQGQPLRGFWELAEDSARGTQHAQRGGAITIK